MKRVKKEYAVISFSDYQQAMDMETFCRTRQIPGRLIPLPPQIHAGCGLCWRMETAEWDAAQEWIRAKGPACEGFHTVRMWTIE